MGTGGKVAVAALAAVAAVVLFFVLREGDEGTDTATTAAEQTVAEEPAAGPEGGASDAKPEKPKPTKPRPTTIVVEGGRPVGGVQDLSFDSGERIRFRVVSDVSDHVHLHGYDVVQDVGPGMKADFDVPATIDGVFEVELEESVVPIAEITVEPS